MIALEKTDTETNKKKDIINRIVSKLFSENEGLYYSPTDDIAVLVKERIQNNIYVSREEKDLFAGTSARDIKILMSYNSSCC